MAAAAAAATPSSCHRAVLRVNPGVMHAFRLRQLAATFSNHGALGPNGVGRRAADLCLSALYHKRNPWDLRVTREDGEEIVAGSLVQSIDEADEQRKKLKRGQEEAKASALKLLAVRSHSRKELKQKLLERGFELHDVRAALDRLSEVGLQSDAEFAETFARSKWRQSKWGPRRIEMELHHRGVSMEQAGEALRSVFGEDGQLDMKQHLEQLGDDPQQQAQQQGQEQQKEHYWAAEYGGAEQMLLEDARRQWERMARLASDARKRRFVAWMQRRGHRWDDIKGLLHQLEKEDSLRAIHGGEAEEL